MRNLILLSFVALTACMDAGGMGMSLPGMSAEDRFVAAMENNGCILNQANTARVLQEADVTPEQVTEIVEGLAAEGKIEPSIGASLRIVTDRCN